MIIEGLRQYFIEPRIKRNTDIFLEKLGITDWIIENVPYMPGLVVDRDTPDRVEYRWEPKQYDQVKRLVIALDDNDSLGVSIFITHDGLFENLKNVYSVKGIGDVSYSSLDIRQRLNFAKENVTHNWFAKLK